MRAALVSVGVSPSAMHDDKTFCCGPLTSGVGRASEPDFGDAVRDIGQAPPDVCTALRDRLVKIDGGFFDMGARQSRFPGDLDSPRRRVRLPSFRIGRHAVTNADNATFVEATGYRTVAEKEGWSYVFHMFVDDLAKAPDYA